MSSARSLPAPTVEGGLLVDVADFQCIQAEMMAEDERREALIKKSRDVLKLSKNSIYALHRGDVERAANMVREAKELAKRDLMPTAEAYPTLRYGSLASAIEEWAEAAIFVEFLKTGRIATQAELEIANKEEYLGGLMDFTGELGRHAVLRATARDTAAVQRCRDAVDQLQAQFMLFDFRNGNLRRKYDGVKYTLKKLEQIIYELTLASSGFVPKSGMEEKPSGVSGEGEGEGEDAGVGYGHGGEEGGEGAHRGGKRPRHAGQGGGPGR